MTQSIVQKKRLERGWTLNQLAEQCSKAGSPTAVSNLHRIESGTQVPRPGLRVVLANLLDLKIEDFEPQGADR